MIYLIHDNEFFYKIWNAMDWITLLYGSLSKFIMTFGIYVLLTFGAGFIGYCIFLLLGKIWLIFKPLIIKKTI